MPKLEGIQIVLDPDEKAFLLVEVNLAWPLTQMRKPGQGQSLHRVQIVYVNRGDSLTPFYTDLGPAEMYKAPQIRIPSLWEHSVAELRDLAENDRFFNEYWIKRAEEVAQESTLTKDFANQLEETELIAQGVSTFGPSFAKQRDDHKSILYRG